MLKNEYDTLSNEIAWFLFIWVLNLLLLLFQILSVDNIWHCTSNRFLSFLDKSDQNLNLGSIRWVYSDINQVSVDSQQSIWNKTQNNAI